MPSSVPYTQNTHHPPRPTTTPNFSGVPRGRPATIAELAERALTDLWDPSKDLKPYLRAAEQYRKLGKTYAEAGDLENAFVQYAKAATVVLEKLPTHRDYATLLNKTQRHNLGLNGQDILDSLSALKPTLVERYEIWLRDHPEEAAAAAAADPRTQAHENLNETQNANTNPSPNRSSRTPKPSPNMYTPNSNIRTPNAIYADPRTPNYSNPQTPSRTPNAPPSSYPRTPNHHTPHTRTPVRSGPSPDSTYHDPSPRRSNTLPSPRHNEYDTYARAQPPDDDRERRQWQDQRRSFEEPSRTHGRDRDQARDRDRDPRREEVVASARQAAGDEYVRGRVDAERVMPATTHSSEREEEARRQHADVRRSQEEAAQRWRGEDIRRQQEEAQRRREEDARRQQDEMRRREEDIHRRRIDERRRHEQEGIVRRQHEAEDAARNARQDQAYAGAHSSSSVPFSSSVLVAATATSRIPVAAPVPVSLARPAPPPSHISDSDSQSDEVSPTMPMPLESPTRYDGDTTDSDAPGETHKPVRAKRHNGAGGDNHHPVTHRGLVRAPTYPPPITTTSPAPPEVRHIEYPSLMSQHQMTQGYVPSLQSMFKPTLRHSPDQATLLFITESTRTGSGSALYPSNALPQASAPIHGPSGYPHGGTVSQQFQQQRPQQQRYPSAYPQHPGYPGPTRAAPPLPPPPQVPPKSQQPSPLSQQSSESRIVRAADTRVSSPKELKTVNLPRECLPRFLSIAALNTARNRETCGLLLGKDKGHKYMVTTLLIPKQHSTSDTCTMDEEELVLQFTEERSLITLGWIHTHPSQSCFMSSVDLHTHSGFQRMLPESFAVVCAPKHTPNFGIFRLTEPPGLQTILDCNAKEAFHPHPDVPIYTDADKGHVQMKDMSLEIVDLR